MSLADIAYFRGMPNILVLIPADGISAFGLLELLLNHTGPAYMRTLRSDTAIIYGPDAVFEPGGSNRVAEGEEVILVAAGYMLHECLKVRSLLEKEGLKAGVIDAYSLPIQKGILTEILADRSRCVLVVEDNFAGGIGSEAAEYSAERGGARVKSMCLKRFPKSGRSASDTFAWLGISPKDIAREALELARKK